MDRAGIIKKSLDGLWAESICKRDVKKFDLILYFSRLENLSLLLGGTVQDKFSEKSAKFSS